MWINHNFLKGNEEILPSYRSVRIVQIPDRLFRVLTKSGLLNRFLFYLFLKLSRTLKDVMPVSFRSELFTSYMFTTFKQRHLLP